MRMICSVDEVLPSAPDSFTLHYAIKQTKQQDGFWKRSPVEALIHTESRFSVWIDFVFRCLLINTAMVWGERCSLKDFTNILLPRALPRAQFMMERVMEGDRWWGRVVNSQSGLFGSTEGSTEEAEETKKWSQILIKTFHLQSTQSLFRFFKNSFLFANFHISDVVSWLKWS